MRLNACELEIDLFCRGLRIDPCCELDDTTHSVARTRAGLGSGLEIILPGEDKDIWVNVPVEEDFAAESPFRLVRDGAGKEPNSQLHRILDQRSGISYPVQLAEPPPWYRWRASSGTRMSEIGVLQGTYLGIYLGPPCLFWSGKKPENCQFCTTGYNVGVNETVHKSVEDVVETCRIAKKISGVTFVHFNSGYQGDPEYDMVVPYLAAVKQKVGALVGLQLMPFEERWKYDRLIELGCDHFSLCFEFWKPDYFQRLCPGKARVFGQRAFFNALEYTASRMPKGAVSGEIIAGLEPLEDTLRAIDYIASLGAFPTVCIFRPTIGSDLEGQPPPRFEDMRVVMRHVYEACMKHGIPIGLAPNIEVSLIVQPTDAASLVPRTLGRRAYELRLRFLRLLARPYFARRMKAQDPSA